MKIIPTNTEKRKLIKNANYDILKRFKLGWLFSTFPSLPREDLEKLKEKLYLETKEQDPETYFKNYKFPAKYRKYANVFITAYANDEIHKLEDIESIFVPMLNDYFLLSKYNKLSLPEKDIYIVVKNRELGNLLEKYSNELNDLHIKYGKDREKQDYFTYLDKHKDEIEVVDENEYATVIIPKTRDASCYWGQNTKWCVSAKEKNLFDYYNSIEKLYFIIPKNPDYPNEKYVFGFNTFQYMNEQDQPVDPVKIFQKFNLEKYISLMKQIDAENFSKHKDLYSEYNPNIIITSSDVRELKKVPEITHLMEEDAKNIDYGHFLKYGKNLRDLHLSTPNMQQLLPIIAKMENLDTLFLKGDISSIPPEFSNLKLKNLIIEQTNQTPKFIDTEILSKLKNLKSITLDNCELTSFPFEEFTHLRELYLPNNRISVLPEILGEYTELFGFSIKNNLITKIPDEINNCKKLDVFDFSKNHITYIPKLDLPELHELAMNKCNLSSIDIFSDCPKIYVLFIKDNKIKDLTPACGLPNLVQIHAEKNLIEEIPDCLNTLPRFVFIEIWENPLKEIPKQIRYEIKTTKPKR